MQHSPNDIKEKLLRAIDKDNNVVDMAAVIEVIDILEKIPITKDELERTRLGKHVNELRKKTTNEMLAKRAKDLVRRWRKLILPQDSSAGGLNGERIVHNAMVGSISPCSTTTSHLPGPGPGPGPLIGGKPASPALVNHHPRATKAISGLAHSSPGNSQCSSASTSPSVGAGMGRLGSNRPTTPGTSSPYASRAVVGSSLADGHRLQTNFQAFKPVSPAPTTTVAGRAVTPGSSSAKHSTPRSVASPAFRHTSPVSDKRNAGLKRTRPDDDESCDSQEPPLTATCILKNSSLPPQTEALANGVDGGDSLDSESVGDSVEIKDSLASEANPAKSKRKRHAARPEKCDVLKEKLASHLRTSKVKTTAELIQELKARNVTGSSAMPTLGVRGNGEDLVRQPPIQVDANLAHARKAVYSSLLGMDEDVTRNKNELMEKFLKDSVGTEVSLSFKGNQSRDVISRESPNLSGPASQYNCKDGDDPVDAILASLPPINAADIRWDEEDEEGDATSPEPVTATDEMVRRLLQDDWEGVNGNSDYQKDFKRWNEMSVQQSYNDDLLHILPYVDID